MNKKYSEDFFITKIQDSFFNKKPLCGLNERKLLKYYKENMDVITSENKKIFEEYILKADLYNNLIKRKKILFQTAFFLLTDLLIIIYAIIIQNFFISFIFMAIEVILVIYLLIKTLNFFKIRNLSFQK